MLALNTSICWLKLGQPYKVYKLLALTDLTTVINDYNGMRTKHRYTASSLSFTLSIGAAKLTYFRSELVFTL